MDSCKRVALLVFGAGSMALNLIPALKSENAYVKGFIDEYTTENFFLGAPIISLNDARSLSYDYILVACKDTAGPIEKLTGIGASGEKIISLDFESLLPHGWATANKRQVLSYVITQHLSRYEGMLGAFDVAALLECPWLKSLPYAKQEPKRHILIDDYEYSPKSRDSFSRSKIAEILQADFDKNKERYSEMFKVLQRYEPFFRSIPMNSPGEDCADPHWMNGWMSSFDGAMIYTVLAENNPRLYVECGSGNTTKFAARAIKDHGLRTKILSIDPHPRSEIDALCSQVFRCPLEDMNLSFFDQLTGDDIFLLDNSHRAFANSDVTVFFTEILPELPPGLIYTMHDIALPFEVFVERYHNEQYMLATYIIGGMMRDSIYFPQTFLAKCTNLFDETPIYVHHEARMGPGRGGFFWLQRG